MSIVITPESEYGKELARWNTPKNQIVPHTDGEYGKNCVGYEPYPAMLYMAQRHPITKQWSVMAAEPSPFEFPTDVNGQLYLRACQMIDQFNRSCQLTVNNEQEHERAKKDGWRDNPSDAMAWRNELEDMVATAAAERNYQDRNMSEAAQAEIKAAEVETHEHVPEIKRRPGRPRKMETEP